MRRLSFISAIVLATGLGCCGQRNQAKEGRTNAAKDSISLQENRRGGTGERMEAPAHGAPDQDRIDSLKREKLKEKNP